MIFFFSPYVLFSLNGSEIFPRSRRGDAALRVFCRGVGPAQHHCRFLREDFPICPAFADQTPDWSNFFLTSPPPSSASNTGGHREVRDRVLGTSRVVFIPRWQQLPKSCTWSKAARKNAGQDERGGHSRALACSRSGNGAKILGGQDQALEPYRWLWSLPAAGWDGGDGAAGRVTTG